MNIKLINAKHEDIGTILQMQKVAFAELYEKYHDTETSPATEEYEDILEPSLESVGQILCALPGKPMFKPPQRSMIIEMRLSMLRKP